MIHPIPFLPSELAAKLPQRPLHMRLLTSFVLFGWLGTPHLDAAPAPHIPVIDGPWIQIAGNPDLGELTRETQQPVDFGVWQAADGTWQLWSCIRRTKQLGKTRLFYAWAGSSLTQPNWRPLGIALQAEPELGETRGGLQAPHVIQADGLYWMFYGDWVNICSAISEDGKAFQKRVMPDGRTGLFNEGPGWAPDDPATIRTGGNNARDPMLIKIGDLWYCYYTAAPDGHTGGVYCRTSRDLTTWSESVLVNKGGRSGNSHVSAECPFVVELAPGEFYLFRTQKYGRGQQTSVYFSRDPMNFGINDDQNHFVATLPIAAPEIITHEGQQYVAALREDLAGIQIAPIVWKPAP